MKAEYNQILYRLQTLQINVHLLSLGANIKQINVLLLYYILNCETFIPSQVYKFWETLIDRLANKRFYEASRREMRLRLPELQIKDFQAWKIRSEKLRVKPKKARKKSKRYYITEDSHI